MRHLFALFVLLAMTTTAGADDQVYKWQDASGQIHYSATPPPPGQAAEQIRVESDIPTPEPAGTPDRQTPAAPPEPAPTATAQRTVTTEQCDIARRNLEILKRGGADRRFRKPDGEIVRFTPEQLQARIEQSETFLAENCHG